MNLSNLQKSLQNYKTSNPTGKNGKEFEQADHKDRNANTYPSLQSKWSKNWNTDDG